MIPQNVLTLDVKEEFVILHLKVSGVLQKLIMSKAVNTLCTLCDISSISWCQLTQPCPFQYLICTRKNILVPAFNKIHDFMSLFQPRDALCCCSIFSRYLIGLVWVIWAVMGLKYRRRKQVLQNVRRILPTLKKRHVGLTKFNISSSFTRRD